MGRKHKKHRLECPACGAKLPYKAEACPECGSDEKTGWSPDADTWSPDIPAGYSNDDDFDYDDFVKQEFSGKTPGPGLLRRRNVVAAVIIIILLAYMLTRI